MATRNLDITPRRATRARAAWLTVALLAACGGGEALLIPFFTFGFDFSGTLGGANHNVSMNLNPNVPTTTTGNFETGTTMTLDSVPHPATGSYSGCTFTLNVAPIAPATTIPAPFAATYSARFTGKDTIEFTPSPSTLPTFTVKRSAGGTDTRATTC